MANKRPTSKEVVTKLRQVEVLTGQGLPCLDEIRQIGLTAQTYYRWSAGLSRKASSGWVSRETSPAEWAQSMEGTGASSERERETAESCI